MSRYHILAVKLDGEWQVAFGDYVRRVVFDEDEKSEYDGVPTRVICTEDNQLSIDIAIGRLNKE